MRIEAFERFRVNVFPAMELLLGVALAEIVAVFQVRASNLALFERLKAAAAAGFQPVPNSLAQPGLLAWESALAGGLFFALTLGAGLALLATVAAEGWSARPAPRRSRMALVCAAWGALLVIFNLHGFDPWASLYGIAVPPPVFALASRGSSGTRPRRVLTRVLPVLLLALVWLTQYDRHLFLDLRDHLLWTNPAGEKVRDFYYRYTLYPAEAFKRLDQRQLRTVSLANPASRTPEGRIAAELVKYDYLPVENGRAADLEILAAGDGLIFSTEGDLLPAVPLERFFAEAPAVLKEVSQRADRRALFRQFILICILTAFPIGLWVLLFGLARTAAGIVTADRGAEFLAAGACLLVGLGVWGWFYAGRAAPPPGDELAAALSSARWPVRVAALKTAIESRTDVAAAVDLDTRTGSRYPQERYWLARALAFSRGPKAEAALLRLLDDSDLNVRCIAVESLGRLRERKFLPAVLARFESSREWYFQQYAYQAIKELGWRQRGSR